MTIDDFRKQCQVWAVSKLGLSNLLDDDDPYEVFEAMVCANEANRSPDELMSELFEEDLAALEWDRHLQDEANNDH